MEECKSPEAEALVAAAVRVPNQAASAAARVEAHAAVAAVQAGVDKRRAEALAPVQAKSEGRRAAAASAAATIYIIQLRKQSAKCYNTHHSSSHIIIYHVEYVCDVMNFFVASSSQLLDYITRSTSKYYFVCNNNK